MINQIQKLKIFISYSHVDEKHLLEFTKHLAPLKSEGLVEDWHDRKVAPGQEFQDKIDENFEQSDIVCLFVSADFLSSPACQQEKASALELKKKKGVAVVPIIISRCGWKDDKDISKLLALPTDGTPVTEFPDASVAWNTVYEGLKFVIKEELKIKQLRPTKQFEEFLQNIEFLTKAHPNKEKVFLDDIFIYPDLDKFNDLRDYISTENARGLVPGAYSPESGQGFFFESGQRSPRMRPTPPSGTGLGDSLAVVPPFGQSPSSAWWACE